MADTKVIPIEERWDAPYDDEAFYECCRPLSNAREVNDAWLDKCRAAIKKTIDYTRNLTEGK